MMVIVMIIKTIVVVVVVAVAMVTVPRDNKRMTEYLISTTVFL